MSTKYELQLQSALLATGMVQPIEIKSKVGKLTVLARQVPGQETQWLKAVAAILAMHEKRDVPDQYDVVLATRFLHKNGQMVRGVWIELYAKPAKTLGDLVTAVTEILGEFRASLAPVVQAAPVPPTRAVSGGGDTLRNDPEVVAARLAAHTTALPRSPDEMGPDPLPPAGSAPQRVRTITNGVGEAGERVIIQEMPLPHVYEELNRPNAKGKGATYTLGKAR